jgi:hypothetical protein
MPHGTKCFMGRADLRVLRYIRSALGVGPFLLQSDEWLELFRFQRCSFQNLL